MLYAVLCYNDEKLVGSWSKDEDEAVMERLLAINGKMAGAGKLGPVARLNGTAQGKTLRKTETDPLLLDGPFAETKEQLLGFYIVDCADMDEALAFARELADANPGPGGYEVRPIFYYTPGALPG